MKSVVMKLLDLQETFHVQTLSGVESFSLQLCSYFNVNLLFSWFCVDVVSSCVCLLIFVVLCKQTVDGTFPLMKIKYSKKLRLASILKDM